MNDAVSGGNDPTTAADVGIGFLMRRGYTIVQSGWDATVTSGGGRQTITVPLATNPDGSSIVGPALEEFVVDNATSRIGLVCKVSLDPLCRRRWRHRRGSETPFSIIVSRRVLTSAGSQEICREPATKTVDMGLARNIRSSRGSMSAYAARAGL